MSGIVGWLEKFAQPVNVRPGMNVVGGKEIHVKMQVFRASEGRWYTVPEERSSSEKDQC